MLLSLIAAIAFAALSRPLPAAAQHDTIESIHAKKKPVAKPSRKPSKPTRKKPAPARRANPPTVVKRPAPPSIPAALVVSQLGQGQFKTGVVRGLTLRAKSEGTAAPASSWPLDGSETDAVGGNHGTIVGKVTPAPGVVGQGMAFDGNGSAIRIYLGGKLVAEATSLYKPLRDLDARYKPGIAIGNTQDPAAYNQPFRGVLDELLVYGRALTQSEIAALSTRR